MAWQPLLADLGADVFAISNGRAGILTVDIEPTGFLFLYSEDSVVLAVENRVSGVSVMGAGGAAALVVGIARA